MKQIYTNLCIVCGQNVHVLWLFRQLVEHGLDNSCENQYNIYVRINLEYPKCQKCQGKMKKISIFTGEQESPVFQGFGLRCSNCQEIVEAVKYIAIPEDYCCDSIKNNMRLNYDEGIIPEYDIKTNSFVWIAAVDGTYAFKDMKYCPFCGKALPLYPASIPD